MTSTNGSNGGLTPRKSTSANMLSNSMSSLHITSNEYGSSTPNGKLSTSQSNLSVTSSRKQNNSVSNEHAPPGALWLHSFRSELQKVIDDGKCRTMTLNECRDVIQLLYDSKDTYNTNANTSSKSMTSSSKNVLYMPETMEQHLYRYMEKKYGLRSISVEHAAMLLTSIRKYCDEYVDINVFYKIFSNDIDEDYKNVHMELQKSIRDLMVVQLMHK